MSNWWEDIKLKAVEVTIETTTDNKDSGEQVTATIKYGPFEVKQDLGDDRWDDQSNKIFLIDLNPHPPMAASFSLHIYKQPQGSPDGHGWKAKFSMVAITENGARVPLGGKSDEFFFGDGHSYDRDVITGAKASA
jgi:hypothetical protein